MDLQRGPVRSPSQAELRWVAQEIHDVVSHGLAAIKMQADVALHVQDRRPDQMRTALDAVSRTSGVALKELRAILAVVSRTRADMTEPATSRLAGVEELLDRIRQAGVQVDLRVKGDPGTLPPWVDLTGYRVLQESLTNVLRHGGGPADLAVEYGPAAMHLRIRNPVRAGSNPGSGLGIPGMRERVLALGGEFSAGPVDGRWFEVCASLPIGGCT